MIFSLKISHTDGQIPLSQYLDSINQILDIKNVEKSENNLKSIPYSSWNIFSSNLDLYRFLGNNNNISHKSQLNDKLQLKPILLVNGYHSNHLTWNFFALRLWELGFKNIFSLELNDYTKDEYQYYDLIESSIDSILGSFKDFKTIILIGHSLGGALSRYYLKTKEALNEFVKISLLITLGTPQYGFPKLSKHFVSVLKHIFVPEAVDVLSHNKGVYVTINDQIDQYSFLKVTMINVQGSRKDLVGGDGIFKPEPVSEMINIVEPRSHFYIHKSYTVFNHLKKFLTHNVYIYKIQLINIKFSLPQSSYPFNVYFEVKSNHKITKHYPIEDLIEVSNNKCKLKFPHIIFTGYSKKRFQSKKVNICLFKKNHLTDELLLENSIRIKSSKEARIVFNQELQNKKVYCSFSVISYKLCYDI